MTTPTDPLSAAHLGHCLARARQIAGLNVRAAARQLGIRPATLRSWEAGDTEPGSDDIQRAIHVYGTDLERIWPDRTPLTTASEPGVLIVGDERVPTDGDNRTILSAYLDAVRRQRSDSEPGSPVELRSNDVKALAGVLDLDDDSLESLLAELFNLTPAGAKLTMRALAVGVLGTIGVVTVLGASWFAGSAAAMDSSTAAAPAPPAAVASPFTTEPSAVAVELAPAVFAVAPATEWTEFDVGETELPAFEPEAIGPTAEVLETTGVELAAGGEVTSSTSQYRAVDG